MMWLRRPFLVALAAAGIAVAALAPRVESNLGDPPAWPIEVTYVISEGDHRQEGEWVADGWQAWRHTVLCCGDVEGLVTEYRPDGSFWSGGLEGLPLVLDFHHPDRDGMTPIPELAPRYEAAVPVLEADPFVTVLHDPAGDRESEDVGSVAEDLASRLGVERTDLIAFEVAREVRLETGPTEARDVRWMLVPLDLTIRVETYLDDVLVRTFEVTELSDLPADFEIPFGA